MPSLPGTSYDPAHATPDNKKESTNLDFRQHKNDRYFPPNWKVNRCLSDGIRTGKTFTSRTCEIMKFVNGNLESPGGGYSHILAIRVCAAGEGMVFKPFGLVKGMVFKPFGLVKGLVIIENWFSIGSRLTGSLTKD